MPKKNYNRGNTLNTRAYSFSLIIYEIDKDYLQNKLDELIEKHLLNHYSYIFHDKDVENDKLKPLHCHLLCCFSQNVSIKQIKERLLCYTEHNIFGSPIDDKYACYRYLTHKDDKDKYQYNDDEIVNYDDYFSKDEITNNKEYIEIEQMINDYSSLSYRALACKYGKDFIKNFKSYQYYFDLIIEQEKKEMKKDEN